MRHPLQSDAGAFITADPFRCRVWDLNDRIEEYVTEESCRPEIASMERDGQLVPAVGRTLKGDPDFDIEIVCGARRLFIARHLGIPIRVELRDLTDRQAAVAVESENSLRKETSPYERGMWLARLLRQGIYRSRDEMARDLRITPTQVTRLLKFAELPAIVIGAFPSPHDILESWAVELHKAWNDDRRRVIAQRCRSLAAASPRPPAVSVYERLVASPAHGGRARARAMRTIVKGPDGSLLLRLERQRTEVVLRIPNVLVDPAVEKELTRMVAEVLSQRKALMAQRTGSRSVDDCRPVAGEPLATFQPVSR
jgi:ParB family chromosome partitioning protein